MINLSTPKMGIAVAVSVNAFLLLLKAWAWGLSDSLAIFSETMNSLADLLGAVVVFVFVRWAHRSHDEDHPFGHGRAEPVAGLVLGLFAGILGIEVSRSALFSLMGGHGPVQIGASAFVALAVAASVKFVLAIYFGRLGKRWNSPAFRASAVDSRNDVLIALQALLGVTLARMDLAVFDSLAALLVGLYILYSAYRVATENIDYLMGKIPNERIREEIRDAADGVTSVHEVDDLRAHYVGTQVHVELTARVDPDLSTFDSHAIAEEVRDVVESIEGVERAFIHIEPSRTPHPVSENASSDWVTPA